MLLVETELKHSNIPNAGLGLFATADIKKGTIMCSWNDKFDMKVNVNKIDKMPIPYYFFLSRYAYRANGYYMLHADNARFMNHSDNPNINSLPNDGDDIAIRDIKAGEELTCDYYTFDEEADEKLGK